MIKNAYCVSDKQAVKTVATMHMYRLHSVENGLPYPY
jgi:hypothetical protein